MTTPEYPYPQGDYPYQTPVYPPVPGWLPSVDPYGRPLSDRSKVTAGLLGISLRG